MAKRKPRKPPLEKATPYNPLDIENLGDSILRAVVKCPLQPLAGLSEFEGAGIYVLFYTGNAKPYPDYDPVAQANSGQVTQPIYVGRAVRSATRTGLRPRGEPTKAIHKRLNNHRKSIKAAATTLDVADFYYKYLVLEDGFISLGESHLITVLRPVWNMHVWGFGSNATGKPRESGKRSRWDTLHPGRRGVGKEPNELSEAEIREKIRRHLAGEDVEESAEELEEVDEDAV